MCLEDGSSDSAISKCSGTGTGSSSGSPSSSIGHHHYFRPLSESEQGRVGCHRCVLMARSPVFKAMLSHNMMESLNGRIIIPDFSLTVVRIMLHFIYSGELPGTVCICMYICAYVSIFLPDLLDQDFKHMFVCINVCMYACMYKCIKVCMYV